jgi:hypothetical protein
LLRFCVLLACTDSLGFFSPLGFFGTSFSNQKFLVTLRAGTAAEDILSKDRPERNVQRKLSGQPDCGCSDCDTETCQAYYLNMEPKKPKSQFWRTSWLLFGAAVLLFLTVIMVLVMRHA